MDHGVPRGVYPAHIPGWCIPTRIPGLYTPEVYPPGYPGYTHPMVHPAVCAPFSPKVPVVYLAMPPRTIGYTPLCLPGP